MKKKYIIFTLILAVLGTWGSCKSDFLTVAPKGSLDQGLLATTAGIDALEVGAYSMLDGADNQDGFSWEPASSNWVWGSIRGLEANKGSNSGDQQDIQPIQGFTEDPTDSYLNQEWRFLYEAISRCNNTIIVTNKALAAGKITQDQATSYIEQAQTLRGWYHFQAYRMWTKIPYLDETTDPSTVSNSDDVTAKIIADLGQGINLPNDMGAIGKFNGTVARVLTAEAMMQINHDYAGALPLLQYVKTSGKKPDNTALGLAPTYGEIFDIANRNDMEAVYTVQTSVNDGSSAYNGGEGEVLNFPYKSGGSPGGCCGFFQPTQEFVNSFDVDANGLPLLDNSYDTPANANLRDEGIVGGSIWDATVSYDINTGCTTYAPGAPFKDLGYVSLQKDNKGNNPITSPAAWKLVWTEDNSKPVDPRLDWSVGRRGIPYWDWGVHTGSDWIRDQTYGGPYSPKKEVYKKSQEGKYTEVGNWTSGYTANGYRMIRYADVLLLLAECQIQTGDLADALINVNLVRARAQNPAGFVMESDGVTPAATYKIGLYPAFPTKDYALTALKMERKLELGQEGHRYFDEQRWGTVVTELNRALTYEETMPWGPTTYNGSQVTAKDVNYPIPQRQIDLSNGKIVQNR
jgi:hypothetical protein